MHNNLLTDEQKDFYNENGYLIIRNLIPKHLCSMLINRAKELIDQIDPIDKTIFTTRNEHLNNYFLESANKIHLFYEEKALDKNQSLTLEKQLSVNKIGHALHNLDPIFYCFSRLNKLASLAHALSMQNPKIVQSMYICKNPHVGSEVKPHQDSTYLYTDNYPITGFWFALEDATKENGCLWALPGGHKNKLKSRLVRNGNNVSLTIMDENPWETDKMIPLEVERGSVILLHGYVPHMSYENNSSKSRHAYTLHIMDERATYAKNNWLIPEGSFQGFN